MRRSRLSRKRLLQLLGVLIAIAIAFALSMGNYEVGNPTIPSGPSVTAGSASAASGTAP